MQYSSPNKLKLLQLSQKLRELDLDDRVTSPSLILPTPPPIEQRLHALTQKLKKTKSKDDSKYIPISNELTTLETLFKSQRRDFEIGINDRQQVAKEIERSVSGVVEELSNDLREEKLGIVKGLEEKVRVVKSEYSESVRIFKEAAGQRAGEIGERLGELREAVERERRGRDEMSEFLIRSFGEEILKLQEVLNGEKTDRVRGNREAMSLIREIEESLEGQIQEEREIKGRNEAVFTRLLEETCYKIEEEFLD